MAVTGALLVTGLPTAAGASSVPDVPELFAEPEQWELPALAPTGSQSALLVLDHEVPMCVSETDGGICVIRSTMPVLSADGVEPHPELGYEYVIWDMSANNAQGAVSGATWETEWRPPVGTVRQGQMYVASVTAAREDPAGEFPEQGSEFVQFFAVDYLGPESQEFVADEGFAVGAFTGELLLSSPVPVSPASVPVGVSWSSATLSQAVSGPFADPLSGGWSIDTGVPLSWYFVREYPATGVVEMWGLTGGRQRFYDNGDGTYRRALERTAEEDADLALYRDPTYGGWRYFDEAAAEYVFDYRGELVEFTSAASDGVGSASYELEWAMEDRLTSVTDPVTGRSVEFRYGGVSPQCSTAAAGLERAPIGSLCEIAVNDDPGDPGATMVTTLGWADGAVAAFLTPGGDRTDVRYDQSGNVVGLRSPIHAAAAALGAIDAQSSELETVFEYDQLGRVSNVALPVLELGGDRGSIGFGYDEGRSVVQSYSPGASEPLTVTRTFDPESWIVERTQDSSGAVNELLVDPETDRPVGARENGTMQTYVEIEDSPLLQRTTWGPAPVHMFDPVTHAPLPAHRNSMLYDVERLDSTEDAWGWLVTWWDDPERQAAASEITQQQQMPIVGSPDGVSGPWSAELLTFVPAIPGGVYGVDVDGAGFVSLRVDGEDGDPNVRLDDDVADSEVIVEVVVGGDTDPTEAAPVTITVTVDDGHGAVAFEVGDHRAGLGIVTESMTHDFLTVDGPPVQRHTVTEYADPLAGLVDRSVSYIDGVEDETVEFVHEGFSTDFSELYRPLQATTPAGTKASVTYWGADERATPPGGTNPVLQGGNAKTGTDPHPTDPSRDGRVVTQWWTPHGLEAAYHDDSTDVTVTYSYDDRLRLTAMNTSAGYQPGSGAMSPPRTMTYNHLVTADGYPATKVTSTVDGVTLTALAVTDFGGRSLVEVDYHGAQIHTTYSVDQITTVTYATTATVDATTTATLTVDPVTGRLLNEHVTALDGSTFTSTVNYDPDHPLLILGIDYGDGLRLTFDYDAYERQIGRTWTDTDGTTWSDHVTLTPNARLAARQQVTNGDTADYAYSFHPNATADQMTFTTSDGTVTWATGFDQLPPELAGAHPQAPKDRTPSTITTTWPDGSTDEITIGYDHASAPQVVTRNGTSIDIAVDRTNIVTYDQTSFVFDQLHDVISVTDGSTEYTYQRDAIGEVVTNTMTNDDVSITMQRVNGGFGLVEGEIANQVLGLVGGLNIDIAGNGPVRIISDHLGNTWATLGPDVTTLNSADPHRYLPYGQPIPSSTDGTTPQEDANDEEEEDVSPDAGYGWLGLAALDLANQVTLTGARPILNEIGSFVSVDPLRVGSTDYSYTDGNPFDYHDRSGNQLEPWMWQAFLYLVGMGLILISLLFPVAAVWKIIFWQLLETAIEVVWIWAMVEAGIIEEDEMIAAIIVMTVLNIMSLGGKVWAYKRHKAAVKLRTRLPSAEWDVHVSRNGHVSAAHRYSKKVMDYNTIMHADSRPHPMSRQRAASASLDHGNGSPNPGTSPRGTGTVKAPPNSQQNSRVGIILMDQGDGLQRATTAHRVATGRPVWTFRKQSSGLHDHLVVLRESTGVTWTPIHFNTPGNVVVVQNPLGQIRFVKWNGTQWL